MMFMVRITIIEWSCLPLQQLHDDYFVQISYIMNFAEQVITIKWSFQLLIKVFYIMMKKAMTQNKSFFFFTWWGWLLFMIFNRNNSLYITIPLVLYKICYTTMWMNLSIQCCIMTLTIAWKLTHTIHPLTEATVGLTISIMY